MRHVLPVMVLLCGLFLAHGVQCAVHPAGTSAAGSIAMSAPNSPDPGMSSPRGLTAIDVSPVATEHSPDRQGGALPWHGPLACLAVLVALLLLVLSAGRATTRSHRRRLLVDGVVPLLSTLQKWRPAIPGLAVLCVSRT